MIVRPLAAVGVLMVALAACGVPTDDPPAFVAEDDVPFGLLARTTTTTPPPVPGGAALSTQVCFVHAESVVAVQRPTAESSPDAALAALRAGPTTAEQATGLRTALLVEDPVRHVSLVAGVARVELTPGFASGGTEDTILAVAQLVCTLTGQPGVGQVTFSLDGGPVEVPRGDGSLTAGGVTRDDYAAVIAPG